MCLTPKNQSQILMIAIQSRRRKSGSWARVQFSTENFTRLLGPRVRITKTISKLPFIWWIPEEYIPRIILLGPSGSPPPHPYPGSIVDLLDSIIPNPSQASGSESVNSVSSRVQRRPNPFPLSFIKSPESNDSPRYMSPAASSSTVPQKRKRATSPTLGGLSAVQKGKRRQTDSLSDSTLIDSDIVILSDSDPDVEVIEISDDSDEAEVIVISD